jgi:hypothetical protein
MNATGMQQRCNLILKRASASRPSGQWQDEDYDVLADGTRRRSFDGCGP